MGETHRFPGARPISGLGPHGEFAASVDQLVISDEAAMRTAKAGFSVGLVLHTLQSDWSRLQIAGIRMVLERYGAELAEIMECGFQPERQAEALDALLELNPDAIISVPVGIVQVADAHRRIAAADIKLVLMDNAPSGLAARRDYVSVVSADNFGNGEVGAELLADHIPFNGHVTILGYDINFYVTNERELGFRKWLREHRPDVMIRRAEFSHPETAGRVVLDLLSAEDSPDAMFVVWDEPAMLAIEALRKIGREMPMTTVDLGSAAALELARGGALKGVGAQLPFDQGAAEATVAIMALSGDRPPAWVALPALAVTSENVLKAYEAVWHDEPPLALREAVRGSFGPANKGG